MALLQAHDPHTEISSAAIHVLVSAMGPFMNNVVKLLVKNGISDLTRGKWYSQQAFFDAFKNIPPKIGNNTVMLIGMKLFQHLKIPPEIDTIEKALGVMDDVYHDNYRNGDAGCYKFRKTGEREGTLFCSSPYPCAFDYGLLKAMCSHFKSADSGNATVMHSKETGCRQTGSLACTYVIKW